MRTALLLARVLTLTMLAALAAPAVWQATTGDYSMTVTGRSMQPTYRVGDVLLVRQPDGSELDAVGNVVVVSTVPGDKSTQYVHRVHETTNDGAVLRGDGNAVSDPSPVTRNHVMGAPRIVLAGSWGDVYRLSQHALVRIIVGVLTAAALLVPIPARPKHSVGAPPAAPDDVEPTASASHPLLLL